VTAAIAAPLIRCNWCSRQLPAYRVHRLSTNQALCEDCLKWHIEAQNMLAGAPPLGCQSCGRSWKVLRDLAPGVEVRMYAVPKDGLLQLLCFDCLKPYVAKRRDLYQNTHFGRNVLKI
jgi:hypothetical protein